MKDIQIVKGSAELSSPTLSLAAIDSAQCIYTSLARERVYTTLLCVCVCVCVCAPVRVSEIFGHAQAYTRALSYCKGAQTGAGRVLSFKRFGRFL